jgi:hypothetical protein
VAPGKMPCSGRPAFLASVGRSFAAERHDVGRTYGTETRRAASGRRAGCLVAGVPGEGRHILERGDWLAPGMRSRPLTFRRAGFDSRFRVSLVRRHRGSRHLAVSLALPTLSAPIPWAGLGLFANLCDLRPQGRRTAVKRRLFNGVAVGRTRRSLRSLSRPPLNASIVMRRDRTMWTGTLAIFMTTHAARAAAPSATDSAFGAAIAWLDAVKRNEAAAVVDSTSLPFFHRSTGLKPKCERSAKTRDDVTHWMECLQRSNDLLLGELRAGDDVKIEPYRGPPIKGFAKLEKGLRDGEWASGFLNGNGVTFTLRFLIVKGTHGIPQVGAFLVKAFFEEG